MRYPYQSNGNAVVKMTFTFSLDIMKLCGQLDSDKKYAYSNQLFRSGTGIGANVMEAQNAESRADFAHKMKMAAKEAEETEYWLLLGDQSSGFPDMSTYIEALEQIKKILNSIIRTTKTGQ